MVINFNDGVSVDTTGELRCLRLKDGYYVVGRGFLIPVADPEEAATTIRDMNKTEGETEHAEKTTTRKETSSSSKEVC